MYSYNLKSVVEFEHEYALGAAINKAKNIF